jgi:hypothetical protein
MGSALFSLDLTYSSTYRTLEDVLIISVHLTAKFLKPICNVLLQVCYYLQSFQGPYLHYQASSSHHWPHCRSKALLILISLEIWKMTDRNQSILNTFFVKFIVDIDPANSSHACCLIMYPLCYLFSNVLVAAKSIRTPRFSSKFHQIMSGKLWT